MTKPPNGETKMKDMTTLNKFISNINRMMPTIIKYCKKYKTLSSISKGINYATKTHLNYTTETGMFIWVAQLDHTCYGVKFRLGPNGEGGDVTIPIGYSNDLTKLERIAQYIPLRADYTEQEAKNITKQYKDLTKKQKEIEEQINELKQQNSILFQYLYI